MHSVKSGILRRNLQRSVRYIRSDNAGAADIPRKADRDTTRTAADVKDVWRGYTAAHTDYRLDKDFRIGSGNERVAAYAEVKRHKFAYACNVLHRLAAFKAGERGIKHRLLLVGDGAGAEYNIGFVKA